MIVLRHQLKPGEFGFREGVLKWSESLLVAEKWQEWARYVMKSCKVHKADFVRASSPTTSTGSNDGGTETRTEFVISLEENLSSGDLLPLPPMLIAKKWQCEES